MRRVLFLIYWFGLALLASVIGFRIPASFPRPLDSSAAWSLAMFWAAECFAYLWALDWIGRRALESFTLKHSKSMDEFRRLRALRDREREIRERF